MAKNCVFYVFLGMTGRHRLRRKDYQGPGKCSNLSKNCYKYYLEYLTNFLILEFYNLAFFAFVWDPQGAKKKILCKIAQFYIKIDIFATYVSNKKAEKENKIKSTH